MYTMTDAMLHAMETPGALAMAFVDRKTGRAVAGQGIENVDLDLASTGLAKMLARHQALQESKGFEGEAISELVLSTSEHIYLLRPLKGEAEQDMFIYLVLKRDVGNLPFARRRFDEIERETLV